MHSIQIGAHTLCVDDADTALIELLRPYLKIQNGYATIDIKNVMLHRFLLGALKPPVDMREFDHADRNPLNCQRENLREASKQENARNRSKQEGLTSQYKGVHWSRRDQRWRAMIYNQGKGISLGMYKDEVEAARAYDEAARSLFTDFSNLNFPP